ncbi:signal peptidase complex subunit 3, putative [Phytophthora infestans T30-4]|uniref:Signal peptidase complex subunit 3 n=2 Tax=Phytophthora infestans TaxID=4787 RepID=D0N9Q7_PHYIT|nr:signal peptidase complex subunit 3, putative [Phytophthora infestans T30-4]EEY54545.1 signal peptidase complex subunit 3, putative [Phytophthora infestans T30-4]|eukprot:XP_002904367.1 signal peptidase complex subunit 3, putative [Phytophthora infestans T30-4]
MPAPPVADAVHEALAPTPAATMTSTPAGIQEDVQSSNAPYAAAQPTPSAMKMASTLPPIAIAQPLGNINQIQSHREGGSNIPVNPNAPQGIYQSGHNSANPSHPYVTVMAMAPISGDGEADNLRFAFLQKCRWMAGCLMAYYVATFLFLQPFILGTLGLLTAFMGYYGSRPPVDAMRLKWLRWYIWANYVMLILNMWLLVVTLVFSGSMFTYGDTDGSDSDSSAEDEYMESTYYYSNSAGLFVGLLVAANTIMHLRCLPLGEYPPRGNMYSVWTRANSVFFTSLMALAIMCTLTAISTYMHEPAPVVRRLEMTKLHSLRNYRDKADRATLSFDLDADLSSVFNWNVKQLFVYVMADFETASNSRNQVVVWDKIVQTMEAASQLQLQDEGVKYFLADQYDELRGANVTLTLEWDIMPVCGRLFVHTSDTKANFAMPDKYQGKAPKAGGRF